MNEPQLETVRLLTLDGHFASDIAAVLGVSARTVERARQALGLTTQTSPHSGRPISPERLAAAGATIRDGASHVEIQRTLRISGDTLRRHFPGTGWTAIEAGLHGSAIRHSGTS